MFSTHQGEVDLNPTHSVRLAPCTAGAVHQASKPLGFDSKPPRPHSCQGSRRHGLVISVDSRLELCFYAQQGAHVLVCLEDRLERGALVPDIFLLHQQARDVLRDELARDCQLPQKRRLSCAIAPHQSVDSARVEVHGGVLLKLFPGVIWVTYVQRLGTDVPTSRST